MKRFFVKSSKSLQTKPEPTALHTSVANPTVHTTSLQPKYIVPPLPHPCPHEYIALTLTAEGLLLRPHLQGDLHPQSQVRVGWGISGKIEEIPAADDDSDTDWSHSVVVHGIVGILKLFSVSYLLVISARTDVGYLLDNRHPVYGIRGVVAIPLTEERARTALVTLASRNPLDPNLPTKVTEPSRKSEDSIAEPSPSTASSSEQGPSSHVKFVDQPEVKTMTPLHMHEFAAHDEGILSSLSSSTASTPTSESSLSTDNVIKTLTARLSFWNKLPLKPSNSADTRDNSQSDTPRSHLDSGSIDAVLMEARQDPTDVIGAILKENAPPPPTAEQKSSDLEVKIIRECVKEFTRGGMYFAYSFDITRSLQHKHELIAKAKNQNALLVNLNALDAPTPNLSPLSDTIDVLAEPSPTLPLWRRVDRQFWWNEWLAKPFIDAGLHSFVLPVMQGFFQIASFRIPREPITGEEGDHAVVDYILISRRSRDRAGLRYQRRGIDDDANVANFVETEAIMRVQREGFTNVFSHVQIRGSIPLYWQQPGYSLKPAPQLSPERSHEQNVETLRRHLQKTVQKYGPHTIVNLAEQNGKESAVSNAYGDYVRELGLKDIQYCAYDFHRETRGMRYENISKLIDQLERIFEGQGYFWVSNNSIMSYQKGVFRVNCIDSLDRTNVVESAFARYVLNRQLGAVALLPPSEEERTEIDTVFNDVWANNGDAISRAYAGTSALKGDFTRTGKRDLAGMLNDGVNSLARMYSSTFADWFSQAVIDYMLGNRNLSVFSEFLLKLQSTDPRDLIRVSRIRAEAIATCVSRVLQEGERLLSGWTLFSPMELNTRMSDKFEEKVLLLTVQALYIISYDYTLEKVKIYTRVPLGDIVGITKGAYILSPLEEGSRDPLWNYGFLVTWRNSPEQDTRVSSYSIKNSVDMSSPPSSPEAEAFTRASKRMSRRSVTLSRILSNVAAPVVGHDTTFAAFKALPIDPARTRRESGSFIEPAMEVEGAKNCKEAVDMIVEAIRQACEDVGGDGDDFITEADIVSVADAQRMTSIYAKMEYGVKRLLWLGG
ncbi:hypothetical protein OBBRIDRAFT_768387 [Obba rivulosa]|uniref:SAC domain-containing protein n=1 Tax=Obba rivulosa TaxID=1052685 RepID=A0A8E2J5E6_9APHY|nr:hypothetical protein OBBRIDRAFT_768387 [Obba rivulosa]